MIHPICCGGEARCTHSEHPHDPSFEHHPETALPAIAPAPGARGRVLIGSAFGARSPILHSSDPLLVDLALAPGTSIELAADVPERALFVVDGELEIGNERLGTNQLAVLCADRPVRTLATAASRILWIGGSPLGPRFIEWNFVSSSREKIDRARDVWNARQFPVIPTDANEFIPWPE